MITPTNPDDPTDEHLGAALTTLSTSADGLYSELVALNRAIDDLQASKERCSAKQKAVSESLASAAQSLEGDEHTAVRTGWAADD
jgi:chromosome segregation ATPase